ncbi:hypothetical protein QYF36_010787 [Acer negundo]|nr:hypothetical protein QYF36_010787 [Acer negundo]
MHVHRVSASEHDVAVHRASNSEHDVACGSGLIALINADHSSSSISPVSRLNRHSAAKYFCPPKPDTQPLMTMTPFSAVAPPPFLAVSRQNIQLNLETIYEDKETDEEIIESSTPCSQFQIQKPSGLHQSQQHHCCPHVSIKWRSLFLVPP